MDMDVDNEVPASDNVQRQMENTSSGERACAHCGKVGKLERCAKCKVTFYCSRSHQAADYAKHKANCHAPMTLENDSTAQPKKRKHDEEPNGSVELDAAVWSRLPFKDVERVLSFLPVSDLCRFRTACKKWNLLISSPEFGSLCAQNAAKRGANSFMVIRYERVCESDDESSDDDESSPEIFFSGHAVVPKFQKYLAKRTPAGFCFLDLNTQRWHVIEDDEEKHLLKLHTSESVGMDGGLVCQYSFTKCEGNSIMVYNPIGKTLKAVAPSADHKTPHWRIPELSLHVVDSTSRSFKISLIHHNFDDREFLADPKTTDEIRLFFLNDPLVRVYDSATNQWKGLKNPPCIQKAVTDVCNVMFQGHL